MVLAFLGPACYLPARDLRNALPASKPQVSLVHVFLRL